MSTEAYPLSWPTGWPRTPASRRERARFGKAVEHKWQRADGITSRWKQRGELTVAEAIRRVLAELDRLGARDVVVSSNVELRQDGLPYSNRRAPDDPGVALYFTLKRVPHCLPCDRWDRVADNLAAVAAHVDAMRGMARWGVGSVEQVFSGFKALPPKGETTVSAAGPAWCHVLGVSSDAPLEVVQAAYRALAKRHHPDVGGDDGAMAAINRAWEQAQAARGAA